jgi:hypothetical protein
VRNWFQIVLTGLYVYHYSKAAVVGRVPAAGSAERDALCDRFQALTADHVHAEKPAAKKPAKEGPRCTLTPPERYLKGAWYPCGFNPCTHQVKIRFQSVLSNSACIATPRLLLELPGVLLVVRVALLVPVGPAVRVVAAVMVARVGLRHWASAPARRAARRRRSTLPPPVAPPPPPPPPPPRVILVEGGQLYL